MRLPARRLLALALLLAAVALPAPASAGEAKDLASEQALERRMLTLAEDLRCLVCQNESLAASRADLAEDMRNEIRNLMRAGQSDEAVVSFLVARYGDFVRYRPPLKPSTWVLWLTPALLLLLGLVIFVRLVRANGHAGGAQT